MDGVGEFFGHNRVGEMAHWQMGEDNRLGLCMVAGPARRQVRRTVPAQEDAFQSGSHGWKLSPFILFHPWLDCVWKGCCGEEVVRGRKPQEKAASSRRPGLKTANRKPNTPPPASGGRRIFRIWAVGVAAGLAVGHEKDQEDDKADQRDKADKHPPTAAAGVVEAAHREGEAGDEDGEAVNRAEQSEAVRTGVAEDAVGNTDQDDSNGVEEGEHPVGLAPRATGEGEVVFPGVEIPVHRVLFFLGGG